VDHVTIRLLDNSGDTIIDLDYDIFQLDIIVLTDAHSRGGVWG